MLVTSKEMLERAKAGGYALVAPDYYDNNSCRAFVQVAEELNKPLILSFAAEVHDSMLSLEEAKNHTPVSVYVDENNQALPH